MSIKRSKNLNDVDIKHIVEIMDGWRGKITWDLLIDVIEARLYNRYTRQALHKHERIRLAFEVRKGQAAEGSKRAGGAKSPELRAACDQIERLQAQNRRLEAENNQLLEQFVRWAYNAHTRGLDQDFLNRDLPPVRRGQTQK